jgi:hypothetical protein
MSQRLKLSKLPKESQLKVLLQLNEKLKSSQLLNNQKEAQQESSLPMEQQGKVR